MENNRKQQKTIKIKKKSKTILNNQKQPKTI